MQDFSLFAKSCQLPEFATPTSRAGIPIWRRQEHAKICRSGNARFSRHVPQPCSGATEHCLFGFQVHMRFHACLRLSWTSALLAVGITPTTTAGFSKGLPTSPTEFTGGWFVSDNPLHARVRVTPKLQGFCAIRDFARLRVLRPPRNYFELHTRYRLHRFYNLCPIDSNCNVNVDKAFMNEMEQTFPTLSSFMIRCFRFVFAVHLVLLGP